LLAFERRSARFTNKGEMRCNITSLALGEEEGKSYGKKKLTSAGILLLCSDEINDGTKMLEANHA